MRWFRPLLLLFVISGVMGRGVNSGQVALAQLGAGEFASLAAWMPDFTAEPDARSLTYSYADFETQAALANVAIPTSTDDPNFQSWYLATRYLPQPAGFEYQVMPDWGTTFGFSYPEVDQVLSVFAGDNRIELYRGRFDPSDVQSAWEAAGYTERDMSGIPVSVFHGDDYLDFSNPVTSYVLGAYNYATILSDGTLVFANRLAAMALVIETAKGNAPSIADNLEVRALITSTPSDLVSIMLLKHWGFDQTGPCCDVNIAPEEQQVEKRKLDAVTEQFGPMPAFSMVLLGESGGGPLVLAEESTPKASEPEIPRSTLYIAMLFEDTEAAESASVIVPKRIEFMVSATSRVPYSEKLEIVNSSVAKEVPVTVIELNHSWNHTGVLEDSLYAKDLRYLLFGEDD